MTVTYCSQCGSKLEELDAFCGECGANTTATPIESAPTMSPAPPTQSPNRQFALWGGIAAIVALLLAGIVLVTRDDGGTTQSATTTTLANAALPTLTTELLTPTTQLPTTVAVTTAVPTTVPAATTPPTTITPPATTGAPTATPALPLVSAGWSPAQIPPLAYPRLSEANLVGLPSPQILDSSAPLPDGIYRTRYLAVDGASLDLEVFRFESCLTLGEGPCFDGPFEADEVGVSDVPVGLVSVPLDATTEVVISGWDCGEVVGQGNGADLAEMYAAIVADYDLAFGPGLAAGTDLFDLMSSVHDNPPPGFRPQAAACDDDFSIVWQYGAAPPVLMQFPFDFDNGGWLDATTLLIPSAIAVNGESTTLYIYAGFFS